MDKQKLISIAVVVSGIDEEYQNNIVSGINTFARENGINVSYFTAYGGMLKSRRFDMGEYSIYNLINFSGFDGAILMTNTICDTDVKENIIAKVKESGIPSVVFDCSDYPEMCNISIDNSNAMSEIVRHVIQVHGAKVLNYISGPMSNPEARARYDSFVEVMNENGLSVEKERIFYGEFRTQDGRQAVSEFLGSGLSLPDAFICANDAMALAAVSALEKAGCKVPDDVIVTGFDYTYNAQNFSPALSSVKRPLYDMGRKACEVIRDMIRGESPEKNIALPSEPVFSESCGCSACDAGDFGSYKKRTYKKIENINASINMLNRLTAGLAETEETNEAVEVLGRFAEELECEKFCICLTDDWQDVFSVNTDTFEPDYFYASYMTAPLIWDKGEIRSSDYFPSREMFPEPQETGGNINYFLPLHFRERCLGYYIITNGDFPIHSLLCHSLSMNLSNSFENIRKLLHLNKTMDELNRLYVIDPLCNIYNRNGFINLADIRFKECAEKGQKVILTFIDMDGLKFINDNYGHNEGDFAIQRLASVIQESCGPHAVCARFGGDEFVVFDTNVTEGDAEALKRRFNAKIEGINSIIKKPYTLSASIGSVVAVAGNGNTIYSIISQADERMYEVKKKRKNSRAGQANS